MHQKLFPRLAALLLLFSLLLIPLPLLGKQGQAAAQGLVSVYYPNWLIYQDPAATIERLPWSKLDRILHAFWKVAPTGSGYEIVPTDSWADIDPSNANAHFPQYAALSARYSQVEVLLSIGGWTCSGHFSQMALTQASRASFIQSCLRVLEAYPFLDGLDIDWEYPGVARSASGSKDEGCPVAGDDGKNYTLLLQALRRALDDRFGPGRKVLTVCAGASPAILDKQDYAALHPYVDAINLMTYDMTGSSAKVTGHHSPLYGQVSASTAVEYLLRQGVPPGKIHLGTPLYSQGWGNVSLSGDPLGASAQGRNKGGTLLWKQLTSFERQDAGDRPGWHAGYDHQAQAAYLWNDDPQSAYYRNFLSYESTRSLDAKLSYLRQKGLGGIMVWQAGGDDQAAAFPMLSRMHAFLHP